MAAHFSSSSSSSSSSPCAFVTPTFSFLGNSLFPSNLPSFAGQNLSLSFGFPLCLLQRGRQGLDEELELTLYYSLSTCKALLSALVLGFFMGALSPTTCSFLELDFFWLSSPAPPVPFPLPSPSSLEPDNDVLFLIGAVLSCDALRPSWEETALLLAGSEEDAEMVGFLSLLGDATPPTL